jgi:predicted nuclease of predicted toxin-antitoxin system
VKLLFDENLSPKLVVSLADAYAGSEHVHACGLGGAADDAVWIYAREGGFAIVSKDADFAERSSLYGSPPKVIWLRGGNCSTAEIETLLRNAQTEIGKFLQTESESVLMVVRRPR